MEERHDKSPQDSSGLDLTVVNSDTKQPIVYSGETDALLCTLTNKTGGPIDLLADSQPSMLEIFLPDFYQLGDKQKMQIKLDGWGFKVNSDDESLVLTCTQAHAWKSGDPLSFQITGAQSSKTPPQGGPAQINPSGMTGTNIPPQVQTDVPLSLQEKPDDKKADLGQVLERSLENEGRIYISDSDSHLVSNTLSLTLKNSGKQPLFSGSGPWPTNPSALLWFVYGDTAGALAPDDKSTPKNQSAWNIQPGDIISEGNSWSFAPDNTDKTKHPRWWLTPNPSNPGILGTGDKASITFELTQVVSHTPVGHTQMYVHCSGFPGYNDALFVLDIDKQELPSPGLIRFSSGVNKVTVNSPDDKLKIPLRWTMAGVSKITLDFSLLPGINLNSFTKPYTGDQPPLQYDNYLLEFSGLEQSATLIITCTAYDHNGQLNDLQQIVVLDFPPVVASYTGELQSDGSLLLKWTTQGATKVALNPALSSESLVANGQLPVQKPPLPLLHNDLYALTAMNDQEEKSDPRVFTTRRFGVVRPTIGVGSPRGIAVSPDSSHVFVTNINDNNVSIIEVNLSNNPPFRILPTPVGTGRQPIGIAVSPDGRYVFVTNYNDDSVTVFGGTPPFQPFPAVHVGTGQDWLAVSPDSRHVFVHAYHSGSLSVIDTANAPLFNVLQGSTLEDMFPSLVGMAVSADGCYAFVIDAYINSLWVLRIEEGTNPYQMASPPLGGLGGGPAGVAVSPDGHYIFVANCGGDSVSVIEVSSGPSFEVLSPPVSAGPRPWALTVSPDGRSLFVTNDNGVLVLVIDKNNHPPVRPLQTLSLPRSWNIAASPDGHFIFVVNNDYSTISVIEPVAVST